MINPTFSPFNQTRVSPIWDKPSSAISTPLNFLKREWVGIKEASKAARHAIRLIEINYPYLAPKLAGISPRLSLLMGIEVWYDAKRYSQTVQTFFKNIRLKDHEGIVLSAFSVTAGPCVILDTFMPFASGLAKLKVIPPILFLNLIERPIGLGLLAYASCRGIYDGIRLAIHDFSFLKHVESEQLGALKEDLQKKLSVTSEETTTLNERQIEVLKDKKVNILTRQTDQKVVALMKKMQTHLETEEVNVAHVNQMLAETHTLIRKKFIANACSTLAAMAMGTAVAASALFTISPLIIPSVALIKCGVFTARYYYER